MQEKYQPLFEELRLNNGVTLTDRLGMCPMLVFASNDDGTPSQLDLDYFKLRNEVGQILITGATTFQPHTKCGPHQLSIENDEAIEPFSKLASVMKEHGNKAIVQLQHPGREASVGYAETGNAYAPSAIDFPFLNYPVKELTDGQIKQIITDFGKATERLIKAGFDGVEIHGANHYLIQQFFSEYSNRRTDFWGGSLEKRMNFPIEVTKEVISVARKLKPDFIVGYRLSPEEIHGENVGYTIDDTLKLVDKLSDLDIDYLHTSTYGGGNFGKDAYKAYALKGNQTKPVNALIKEKIAKREAMIVSGSVKTPDDALDALNYGDIVAMGVVALSDPEFTNKIINDQIDQINLNVKDRLKELVIPEALVEVYKAGAPLPPLEGLDLSK
ncbi:hypothetical protein [Xylocopilactobacillus apis]|uniref:NADH-dependent oxidoreductase n=1 Tax=Xylocopilactobacillus apis TaxID=2932183 RepID=A0AAU9CZU3_9LACO|nr:hypothetical protein [Xylocopilactobacillus apis]BDR56803.1 NADH-dependent oxidoreductase [Xylocopilactobacillus apis]